MKWSLLNPPAVPFTSDGEYVHSEIVFLMTRRLQILAEADEALERIDAIGDPEGIHRRHGGRTPPNPQSRATLYRVEEERLRTEIDARLEIHRASTHSPMLGLDKICQDHGLSRDERLVLLVLVPPALGRRICEVILAQATTYYSSVSVEDVISILAPESLEDHLDAQALFYPDSRLREAGLVKVIERMEDEGPGSLLHCEVVLTAEAFSRIVGAPKLLTEFGPQDA